MKKLEASSMKVHWLAIFLVFSLNATWETWVRSLIDPVYGQKLYDMDRLQHELAGEVDSLMDRYLSATTQKYCDKDIRCGFLAARLVVRFTNDSERWVQVLMKVAPDAAYDFSSPKSGPRERQGQITLSDRLIAVNGLEVRFGKPNPFLHLNGNWNDLFPVKDDPAISGVVKKHCAWLIREFFDEYREDFLRA